MTHARRSHDRTGASRLGPPGVAQGRSPRPRSSGASGPDSGRTARAAGSTEALPRRGTAAGRSGPAGLPFGTPFGEEATEDVAGASPEEESRPFPRPEGVRRIAGGVVAFNDEGRVERSIRSLLAQELPPGYEWSRIWLVASGCTDRTAEVGRAIARQDPRLEVVVEPIRRGKAAAIREVLRRAEGEALVLLNSDAFALPGAVSALLRAAEGRRAPYAVMGRPVVPEDVDGIWADSVRWMWELHHVLHLELLAEGRGAHLSDELLLLSLPTPVPLGVGIINDGSFLGVWLSRHQGGCWYAPGSLVSIEVPRTVSDFLRQRRRIHVGNAQVRRLLGHPPATIVRYLFDEPMRALRLLGAMLRRPSGPRHFLRIAGNELLAHALAAWDRVPPARDHIRWTRIESVSNRSAREEPWSDRAATTEADLDRRVRALMDTAREFATGIRLDQLTDLLPATAPRTPTDLGRWLEGRTDLVRLEGGWAYPPDAPNRSSEDRRARGEAYRAAAEQLVRGPLRASCRWVRCIGISGSVAYGEPADGDDLDLFVVTRAGSLWWFLAVALASLWLARRRGGGSPRAIPCLNYVLDDMRAERVFASERGFLFAREALTVETVVGERYYAGLLDRAPWMAQEVPRLYERRTRTTGANEPARASFPVRLVNAAAFLVLAPYLQAVGLVRNRRLRLEGRRAHLFDTRTEPHGMMFASRRFESIRRMQEPGPADRAAPSEPGRYRAGNERPGASD